VLFVCFGSHALLCRSLLRAAVSVFAELCVLFASRPSLPPHVQRQWAQFTELLLLLAHKYASFLDKSGDDARSLEALRLRHALLGAALKKKKKKSAGLADFWFFPLFRIFSAFEGASLRSGAEGGLFSAARQKRCVAFAGSHFFSFSGGFPHRALFAGCLFSV